MGYGVVLPYATNYFVLLLAVALVATTSGLLISALAYMVSLAAGTAQGAALGKQTVVASLGQAVGSVSAGWLFGLFADAPFWMTAGLLVLGMVMAIYVSKMPAPRLAMNKLKCGEGER
jgi:MFS transporter, DHA1 family, multidrug resistance protein